MLSGRKKIHRTIYPVDCNKYQIWNQLMSRGNDWREVTCTEIWTSLESAWRRDSKQ